MTMQSQLVSLSTVTQDLRVVVLLAGRVGSSAFGDGAQRSVLDLPVDSQRTVLDVWTEQLGRLALAAGSPRLPVRIALDHAGVPPTIHPGGWSRRLDVQVVRDAAEYRGTAGVVRDVTGDLAPDDRLLVVNASQLQREPVADILAALMSMDEGVSLVPHGAGDLAGMFLLRRDRLSSVPEVGFVDLKEQTIPSTAQRAPLGISRRGRGTSLPIRTRAEYIEALRVSLAPERGGRAVSTTDNPFAEAWAPSFAIVEDGADVAADAVLQDSVVLRGARVESGAVVARTVVCPGGVVRRGSVAIDATVTG